MVDGVSEGSEVFEGRLPRLVREQLAVVVRERHRHPRRPAPGQGDARRHDRDHTTRDQPDQRRPLRGSARAPGRRRRRPVTAAGQDRALTTLLVRNYAWQPDAAAWAVRSCAWALGLAPAPEDLEPEAPTVGPVTVATIPGAPTLPAPPMPPTGSPGPGTVDRSARARRAGAGTGAERRARSRTRSRVARSRPVGCAPFRWCGRPRRSPSLTSCHAGGRSSLAFSSCSSPPRWLRSWPTAPAAPAARVRASPSSAPRSRRSSPRRRSRSSRR